MTLIRFACNKLIRDNILQKLEKKGITVHARIMEHHEHLEALAKKLVEEAHECVDATNKEELTEELGDMLELIHAMVREHNLSFEEIEKKRLAKKELNGGFDKKIFCSYIEMEQDNPHAQYYKDRPKQYPIIE